MAEATVALVTGGSRGIGRAICAELARRGFAVAVHYHASEAKAREVVASIAGAGGRAEGFAADLATAEGCRALAGSVARTLGDPLVFVHNAGEMTDVSVEEMEDSEWERSLSLHLGAAFRLARALLPGMRSAGRGRIVVLSSQAAFTGSARHAQYAAAKAGLHGFVYSLAKEVGPAGITVNLVAPGRIETEMVLDRATGRMEEWMAQTPLRRLGKPEEVAAAVAFLVSEEASYITGATLHVNGGQLMS